MAGSSPESYHACSCPWLSNATDFVERITGDACCHAAALAVAELVPLPREAAASSASRRSDSRVRPAPFASSPPCLSAGPASESGASAFVSPLRTYVATPVEPVCAAHLRTACATFRSNSSARDTCSRKEQARLSPPSCSMAPVAMPNRLRAPDLPAPQKRTTSEKSRLLSGVGTFD